MNIKNLVKFALYIEDDNQGDLAHELNSYQSAISDALKGSGSCPDHLKQGISLYTEDALVKFLKELLPKWAYSTDRKEDGIRVYVKRYINQKWKEIGK